MVPINVAKHFHLWFISFHFQICTDSERNLHFLDCSRNVFPIFDLLPRDWSFWFVSSQISLTNEGETFDRFSRFRGQYLYWNWNGVSTIIVFLLLWCFIIIVFLLWCFISTISAISRPAKIVTKLTSARLIRNEQ